MSFKGLHIKLSFSFIVVLFTLCSSKTYAQKEADKGKKNIFLADPTIFYDKDTYYLYGTGGNQYNEGFAVYTSPDLKTWKGPVGVKDGYALKKGDAYGDAKFWAPQVFQYKNKYYIAYAANEHIGIAVSDNPLGPFTSKSTKPISEETKQIDPYLFIDSDGKKYIYYVVVANGGNRIYVAEMNDDMLSVKKETAKLCVEATEKWENIDPQYSSWSVIEGPTLVKQNDMYYLLYSANHFKSVDYAVGYAVSKSPYGPWKKHEGNPIIHKSITGQNGSGHGDLVKGKDGDWYYVFHTHNSSENIAPRKTGIIKLEFKKDNKTGIDKLVAEPSSFKYLYQ
jgi:xylan 1,4-beta-xylosidase